MLDMKFNIQDCSLLINHTATVKMANKNVDEIPQAEWEFSWPVSIAQCRDKVFSLLADYMEVTNQYTVMT